MRVGLASTNRRSEKSRDIIDSVICPMYVYFVTGIFRLMNYTVLNVVCDILVVSRVNRRVVSNVR